MRVARILKSPPKFSSTRRKLGVLAFGLVVALAVGSTTGQTGASTQTLNDTQILFLGTAGGPPLRADRSEPSTLLVVDGRAYLIDCGIGTMRRMLEAGIRSEQIKTIFFTHLHSDHDLGLADVMANDYFRLGRARSTPSINIYGPPQTKELVEAAFHYITITVRPFASENRSDFHVVNGEFASPFVAHEIDHEGVIFQDDKIRVIAAENTHYALMPAEDRKQLKSFSYRFETPHGAIVFTGDTAPSDAVARLAKGADVLLAEVSYRDAEDLDQTVNAMAALTHATPERAKTFRAHFQFEHLDAKAVGELASKAQVKSVLLYHYNPADKADEAAFVTGAKRYFSGPVFAPADLERYCLGRADAKSADNGNVLGPCAAPPQPQKANDSATTHPAETPRRPPVSASASCPSCCTMPASERSQEEGCYVIANEALESLPPGPLFWHLYTYPTTAAASEARGTSSGSVVESFGKSWLFKLAPADWKPPAGEKVAVIGPLPVPLAKKYFARYMESIEAPTVAGTPVHTHPGPEAWYLVSGAQCLRTPSKAFVLHSGDTGFVPGGEPMMLKPNGTEPRHSLVLVLHDASQPWRRKTEAWQPQRECPQ
jgi:ribonuclease BN (tRNA processing enzyme)/quercetin dioxygenase-like cupin family protein